MREKKIIPFKRSCIDIEQLLLPLGCKEMRIRAANLPHCVLDYGYEQHDCISCIYRHTNPYYINRILGGNKL